LKSIG